MPMTPAKRPDRRLEDALIANEADLSRYFRRRMGSPADADDIYGEFLLAAWRSRRKTPESLEDARLWLFGVARNVLMNFTRASIRRKSASDRLTSSLRDEPQSIELDAALDVRAAVASLDRDAAELVRLIYWDGLRSHEAAQVLGINPSTARSRLSEAKRRLRVVLDDGDDTSADTTRDNPSQRANDDLLSYQSGGNRHTRHPGRSS